MTHDLATRRWAAGHAVFCRRCGVVVSVKKNYDEALGAMAGYLGHCPTGPASKPKPGG